MSHRKCWTPPRAVDLTRPLAQSPSPHTKWVPSCRPTPRIHLGTSAAFSNTRIAQPLGVHSVVPQQPGLSRTDTPTWAGLAGIKALAPKGGWVWPPQGPRPCREGRCGQRPRLLRPTTCHHMTQGSCGHPPTSPRAIPAALWFLLHLFGCKPLWEPSLSTLQSPPAVVLPTMWGRSQSHRRHKLHPEQPADTLPSHSASSGLGLLRQVACPLWIPVSLSLKGQQRQAKCPFARNGHYCVAVELRLYGKMPECAAGSDSSSDMRCCSLARRATKEAVMRRSDMRHQALGKRGFRAVWSAATSRCVTRAHRFTFLVLPQHLPASDR